MSLRNSASIAVILFGAMSLGLVFGCVIPILPSIALHFGGSSGAVIAQLVFAIACVGLMCGGPIAGWAITLYDPRNVLLAALAMFSLAGGAGLLLDSAFTFLISRFVLGLSAAAINTAGVTLISQRFEPQIRMRVLGYYNACGPIASVLALALSGVVSEKLGWRGPFLFYLIGLVVFGLALFSIPASRPTTPRQGNALTGRFWRPLLPFYTLLVPLSVPLFTASLQIPFLLAEHGYARPALIATIAAISSISVSTGALCYGRLRLALNEKGVLILMLTAIGAGHLILGSTQALPLTALGAIVTQVGGGMLLPHFLSLLLDRTPVATHGPVSGWVYSAHFLGMFMNSPMLAPINALIGIEGALVLLGAILLAAAVAVAVHRPRPLEPR